MYILSHRQLKALQSNEIEKKYSFISGPGTLVAVIYLCTGATSLPIDFW